MNAKQFVEFQAVLRTSQQLGRLREVDIVQRLAQGNQPVSATQRLGPRILDTALDQRPKVANDIVQTLAAELRVGQSLGGAIHPLQTLGSLARAHNLLDLRVYHL